MKDILDTISKIRLIESRQIISEELSPEEKAELDALAKELEPEMGRIPELDALLLQHKKLATGSQSGQAAQPGKPAATGGMLRMGSSGPEVEKLQKDLGIQPADGKFGPATDKAVRTFQQTNKIQVDGIVGPETRAAIEKSQAAGKDPEPAAGQVNKGGKTLDAPVTDQPAGQVNTGGKKLDVPVNPANPSGRSSKMDITPDQAQAVLDNGSERDIAAMGGKERLQQLAGVKPAAPTQTAQPATPPAQGQAAQPATPTAGGTTTTKTNTQVSGTMRMGKPDGPIQYNGKTVNPGDADYGAASQALIDANKRSGNRVNWRNNAAGKPSTAPVQQGASQARDRDF